MTPLDVIDRTRCFILENFLYARPDVRLSDDEHLFDRGIIDSMGALELMQFLQDEFGIQVDEDEMTEQNFESLRAIGRFVASKQADVAA
jgi:acyl carrier protein